MGSQQFCLKWNNHQLNMLTVFDQLLQNEAFVDVTIACEGLSLKAHKMVLSACSPYFQNLFMDNPCKHPIVILKDIRYDEMKAIIDFMYKGEVNVSQDQLSALLKTAEALKVKGLAEVTGQGPHGQVQQSNSQSSVLFETVGSRHSPPAKRKKRPPASAPVSIGSPVSPGNSNTSHSTSSHRALSPPHPVVQSAVSLAPVASVGSSATTSGMCSGDEEQTPLMGLNRSRNIEGVPGSSKDSLSNVKEEKIEMEEPPDEVEDLIMEATPEHIEIEPSTTDTGFNGSTQDQSQLANIKYGNMFNPQPSTSGTSPDVPMPIWECYRPTKENRSCDLAPPSWSYRAVSCRDLPTASGYGPCPVSLMVASTCRARSLVRSESSTVKTGNAAPLSIRDQLLSYIAEDNLAYIDRISYTVGRLITQLMEALFTRTEIGTSSVTGKKSCRMPTAKKALDPTKVSLIIAYVLQKFPEESAVGVKQRMAQKCKKQAMQNRYLVP